MLFMIEEMPNTFLTLFGMCFRTLRKEEIAAYQQVVKKERISINKGGEK